jgi:hypothetical protein
VVLLCGYLVSIVVTYLIQLLMVHMDDKRRLSDTYGFWLLMCFIPILGTAVSIFGLICFVFDRIDRLSGKFARVYGVKQVNKKR